MSVTTEQAQAELALKLVVARCMDFYAPKAKKWLGLCLFGPARVLAGQRRANAKQSAPSVTIFAAGSDLIIGRISGDTTLYEALRNGDVLGTGGRGYFNLCELRNGVYCLLPYNVPISELPREVFLVIVDEEHDSKEEFISGLLYSRDFSLYYASDELKADPEVVRTAIQKRSGDIEYASPKIRADREFMLLVVKEDWFAMEYVSPELKADRELQRIVFSQRWLPLNPKPTIEEIQRAWGQ